MSTSGLGSTKGVGNRSLKPAVCHAERSEASLHFPIFLAKMRGFFAPIRMTDNGKGFKE